MRIAVVAVLCLCTQARAGEWQRELKVYSGSTPVVDGEISPAEWADAITFTGVKGWTPQFTPTQDSADLSLKGWAKYDDKRLYFAFEVTDDVLYGIDTERWLPEKNPQAHELTPEGWPWFGDEMELLINASHTWAGDENARGDGQSWQMVCNLTKSRLGGVGIGGLLEGEPRTDPQAWANYQRWIISGAMQAAVKVKAGGKGYAIEWSVAFDPCLEIAAGKYFQPGNQETVMGLNIAVGDLDEKSKGKGNFGNFHHEDWFAGEQNKRTNVRQWGRLILVPKTAQRP